MTLRTAVGALVGLSGLVGSALAAPAAQAEPVRVSGTPVTVQQIPTANAWASAGLVLGRPALAVRGVSAVLSLQARTGDTPGRTVLSVRSSGTGSSCSSVIGPGRPDILNVVDVDYVNITTGRAGHARLSPCTGAARDAPAERSVTTGSGPIAFTSRVTVRIIYPDRIPLGPILAVPGTGYFTAR
ncbi:MAG: hypothetical protein WBA05_03260 [Gordonia sp. (in: high G+C Gram-positive bacteria)]|uniref:hypothetical protein n=1 Tax=Gordonia TaxID=2053 RepID=UPI003265E6BA